MAAKETESEDQPTESDWLFEYIDNVMKSPAWDSEVMTFVDDHCVIFDNEEENKFEYTVIHEQFSELMESLMTRHLKDISVTPEAFAEACEKARFASRNNRKIFEQLIALTDFLTFKKIMVKRNMELELEAVRELQQQAIPIIAPADEEEAEKLFQMALKESAEMSVAEAQELLSKAREEAESSKQPDPEDGVDQDLELRKAMDLNLMELELQNRQFEMEQQELEQALAMSLFMEQERIRHAQEEEEEEEEYEEDEEESSPMTEGMPARAEVKGDASTVPVSPAKGAEDDQEKGQDKVVANETPVSIDPVVADPKPNVVPEKTSKDETPQSTSSFLPTSLQAAPLISGVTDNTEKTTENISILSSFHPSTLRADPKTNVGEKDKKKKKKKKVPSEGLVPLGTPKAMSGLTPLPSVDDLQKQMQKRRLEAEEAFRKNQEALSQQKQTEKELTAAAGVTPEDAARRTAYLKEQRDKIIAKKRAERESKAKAYEDEKEVSLASMMAEASQPSGGAAEAKETNESEERRNMMRIALARRMKRDLLISESDRLRTMQEEQYSDLDKQLRMVQNLRQENQVRERELGDQIKRQQEQRFRNLQHSVASQVLEH